MNRPSTAYSSHGSGSRNDNLVTCAFYNKIGACRHGEKCAKKHIRPTISKTILVYNLYQNPKLNKTDPPSEAQIQETFNQFYRDIFIHFAKLGEVSDIVVCENENNHLNGNVYVRYKSEDQANDAAIRLNQEWFNGRPVHCELSPVDSFPEANCRAYDTDSCERAEHCNYMHVRRTDVQIKDELVKAHKKSCLLKRLLQLKQDGNIPTSGGSGGAGSDDVDKDETDNKKSSTNKVTTSIVQQLFA